MRAARALRGPVARGVAAAAVTAAVAGVVALGAVTAAPAAATAATSSTAGTTASAGTSATTTETASSAPAGSGLVQRDGRRLVTPDGSEVRFVGMQAGLAASPSHPYCSVFTDEQVRTAMDESAAAGATVLRVWLLQSYGGPQDWSRFELLSREASARGLRLLATLVNHWGACDAEVVTGQAHRKDLAWYQSGYRQTGDGYPLSFRDYVRAVAEHFRDDPTFLAWQLGNEIETSRLDGSCDDALNDAGALALRAFADDLVQVVRSTGDRHLVSLGTMGGGQCGTSGSERYRFVHAGLLDVCEYHDYTALQAMPGDEWNGLATRLADCAALGKPLWIDEAGIYRGVTSTGEKGPVTAESLARRAALFDAKLTAQLDAGVTGVLVWQKSGDPDDDMGVPVGDPLEQVLRTHAARLRPSAATAPPTTSPTTSPTAAPTVVPTLAPTAVPTLAPTAVPTLAPTAAPVLTTRWAWQGRLPAPSYRKVHSLGTSVTALRVALTVRTGQRVDIAVRSAGGTVLWSRRVTGPVSVPLSLPRGAASVTLKATAPVGYGLVVTRL